MANTTNFNWETPDDTDLVKDGALAIRTLGSAIDTSLIDLKGGTTGQVLSKATNTDMDFSWVAQDDSNAIQNAIVDAKGDLISATANDTPARLAVGANDTVLTADSSTATGLKWAAPASGGGLTLLSTTSLTSTSTEISISASAYKNLRIIIRDIYLSASNESVWVRLNADTGSNYAYGFSEVIGSSAGGGSSISDSKFRFNGNNTNANTLLFKTQGEILIPRSQDTDLVQFYARVSGYTGANPNFTVVNGRYDNAAAITSITFATLSAATFSGGTVYVYGEN
jgi:hypothetical protein